MDRDVLAQLYERYYQPALFYLLALCRDRHLAEDLVQDLFVALWEKGIDRQLESKGVRAYLYTAVRNKAVRALKGERKTVDLPDIADMLMVWEDVDMSRQQLFELVPGELEKLPPRSREVLECIHLKNMKYAEVAELLGISVATVKTLLVRSLKTLRGIVSDTAFLLYVLVYGEDHRRSRSFGKSCHKSPKL